VLVEKVEFVVSSLEVVLSFVVIEKELLLVEVVFSCVKMPDVLELRMRLEVDEEECADPVVLELKFEENELPELDDDDEGKVPLPK
jgi:hypothetical protein